MNTAKLLKNANSKGKLANAVVMYQRALSHYANESNWAVKGDDIIWLGDDDPTYAAQISLGQRKSDPGYFERNKQKFVREPDGPISTPEDPDDANPN